MVISNHRLGIVCIAFTYTFFLTFTHPSINQADTENQRRLGQLSGINGMDTLLQVGRYVCMYVCLRPASLSFVCSLPACLTQLISLSLSLSHPWPHHRPLPIIVVVKQHLQKNKNVSRIYLMDYVQLCLSQRIR